MKNKNTVTRMTVYAGNHKYLTYTSLVLSGISAALSVVPFYYIWLMLDEVLNVMPDYSLATDLVYNGWMAVLFTILSVAAYTAGLMCSHIAAFRVAKNMKKTMMAHVMSLPPGAFDMMGSGKVRRTIQDSSAATETYLAHEMPDIAGTMVLPIAILAMLFVFDWRLGLASLVPIAVSVVAMFTMVGSSAMRDSMETYQTALSDVNKEAVEYVRGISVVKAFQQTVGTFQSFKSSIYRYSEFAIDYCVKCRAKMCLFIVACNCAFVALVIVAFLINGGTVWSEEFLLDFMFYIIFTPLITVLLNKIMYASNESYIVNDALDRVDALLAIKPLDEPKDPKEPSDWNVRFEDVTFTYPENDRPAVNHLNLILEQGTVTALVGASGSGKSTIASLACRFWDPQFGRITIGNVDLKDISCKHMTELTTFVFQDNHLIKGTLLENVKLGRPECSDKEVSEALHLAQCDDIVSKLSDGLNTMIGPGGTYLSGGEVQRVSVARAILKDSPIIILDEATAFADPENEYLMQKAFDNLTANKTVLLIAHRLTTVKSADLICIIDDGSIIESGTHKDLIESKGTYDRMWTDYQRSLDWKVKGAI